MSTPEPVPHNPYAPSSGSLEPQPPQAAEVELADRGMRLVARLLDVFILAFVSAPRFGGVLIDSSQDMSTGSLAAAIGSLITLVLFIAWTVVTIRLVASNGQTLGKKACAIKIVRKDGSQCSLGRIFWLRYLVNTLLGIIPLYGLVDALRIFGEERRCLHDLIADTIVVKA